MSDVMLAACPFCGGEANFMGGVLGVESVAVCCRKCSGKMGYLYPDFDKAAEAWNQRVEPPEIIVPAKPGKRIRLNVNGTVDYVPDEREELMKRAIEALKMVVNDDQHCEMPCGCCAADEFLKDIGESDDY